MDYVYSKHDIAYIQTKNSKAIPIEWQKRFMSWYILVVFEMIYQLGIYKISADR